jgi:hypothetical protein
MLFLFFVQIVKAEWTRVFRSRPDLRDHMQAQSGLFSIALRVIDSVRHFTNLESKHFG